MLLGPSRVSHARSRCQIRVSVENILLILLRNPHVDRHDPVDPADPAPFAARPRTLTASHLGVPTTLDPTEVPAITAPKGKPRVGPRTRLPDRPVTSRSRPSHYARRKQQSAKLAQITTRSCCKDGSSRVMSLQKRSSARSPRLRNRRHNEPPRRSIIGRRRSVWRRLRLHTRAEGL
jgi:hypothetical protein